MEKNKTGKRTNREIADVLEQIADILESQDANPHRVRAYRDGASRARSFEEGLSKIVVSGNGKALKEIPDIGDGLARVITRYVHNGYSDILDRLQGEASPQIIFSQVPGIGPKLAERVIDQLEIDTLEDLEQAAHDGRLADVEGFGPKRIQSVRVGLAGMLSSASQRRARQRTVDGQGSRPEPPNVATILDVDAEYRSKAEAGTLRKIAPKRFNPENKAWLPILHTSRHGFDCTVLFSNTARAHELEKTDDWVVFYFEKDDWVGQATVVTATQGILKGLRVVRGREVECERYYGYERMAEH
jgi:Holliday junction resolvasome RuvABC DNA-binding subunit